MRKELFQLQTLGLESHNFAFIGVNCCGRFAYPPFYFYSVTSVGSSLIFYVRFSCLP